MFDILAIVLLPLIFLACLLWILAEFWQTILIIMGGSLILALAVGLFLMVMIHLMEKDKS